MSPHPYAHFGVDGAKSGWFAVWRLGEAFGFDLYARAEHLVSAHA